MRCGVYVDARAALSLDDLLGRYFRSRAGDGVLLALFVSWVGVSLCAIRLFALWRCLSSSTSSSVDIGCSSCCSSCFSVSSPS